MAFLHSLLWLWRNSKFQFYYLCFDLSGTATHDRPHLKRASKPLHHQACNRPVSWYNKSNKVCLNSAKQISSLTHYLIRKYLVRAMQNVGMLTLRHSWSIKKTIAAVRRCLHGVLSDKLLE
jgi:hypothetical protein